MIIGLLLGHGAAAAAGAATALVSVRGPLSGSPAGGAGDSGAPILSPDGRYVAFASAAHNLVLNAASNPIPTLTPAHLNVYLQDRLAGSTELITVDHSGLCGADSDSLPAQISINGQFVLFTSAAGNLVHGDTNSTRDVFVRDRLAGTTVLVSTSTNAMTGSGASYNPTMTPDGRYVAFASAASNLVAGDTNGIPDVFIRDLAMGTTELVSVGSAAKSAFWPRGESDLPQLTPDGRYVAFFSSATNLVPGVAESGEVYLRDLLNSVTHWVSSNADLLLSGEAVAHNPRISSNGQYAAFEIGLEHTSLCRVVRHHILSGMTEWVSSNATVVCSDVGPNLENLDMTPDARFIVFRSEEPGGAIAIRRWDAASGTNRIVSQTLAGTVPSGSSCHWPVTDANGRYVAFTSDAPGMTTNSITGGFHVYVRDTSSGTTHLADAGTTGTSPGVGSMAVPALSGNGLLVAFECPDGELVAHDNNRAVDVFLKDLSVSDLELVSAHHPDLSSLSPNGQSLVLRGSVSSNGQFVAFAVEADNLGVDDTNGVRDIMVRDRDGGSSLLVTVSTNGGRANGISTDPSISGSGRYVAFSSVAGDLVVGDTNRMRDVFLRDVQGGTTLLVSANTGGTNSGNNESFGASVSHDGRFVLFESRATDIAPGIVGSWNLFLRDNQLGATVPLTSGFSSPSFSSAAMTPDGRYVAFIGVIPPAVTSMRLYVWDTQLGARIYTNAASGFDSDSFVAISPGGKRVAYTRHILGTTAYTLQIEDVIPGTNRTVSSASYPDSFVRGRGPRCSHDGRFLTYAQYVGAGSLYARFDVFLYDFASHTNTVVSRAISTGGAPDGDSYAPDISADGRWIAYLSEATDIVSGDQNGRVDVLLYDRLSGVTTLLSSSRQGATSGDNLSMQPWFSADGKTLLWSSWASDLASNDCNQSGDVFAFELPPTVITDTDMDGMDDQWERDHFLTLARDGTGDFDGDGASDLFEFQTCTLPTDSTSLFRAEIVFVASPDARAELGWTAAPGKAYRVEWKASLSDPTWEILDAPLGVLGTRGVAYDVDVASGHKVYRISLIDP